MTLSERLVDIDDTLARGNFVEAAGEFFDKSVETHIQNLVTLKGKAVTANLSRLEELIAPNGTVEVLGQRVVDADNTTVSLLTLEGGGDGDARLKLLLLIARKWNDEGKVIAEEYLPVRSSQEAQSYFPDTRLNPKQVQPKLSFVTPSRRRRKGGGRPPKPVLPTDLHRLPQVGKRVLNAFREVGIETFEALSNAGDEILDTVRAASGRKFVNFDPSYWRTAATHALNGEWDKIPAPNKSTPKKGKKAERVDLPTLADTDLGRIPKVGPSMLAAFANENIHTFQDLASVDDHVLEALRAQGGRPFVNFDMTYFREAAQRKVEGARSFPAPPSPAPKRKPTGKRGGRKPREAGPTDLHLLPGVGKQLITALHDRGVMTFADLANAEPAVLQEARAQTRGKYKNIDLNYLRRSARLASEGKLDKVDPAVKIEKATPSAKGQKVDRTERHLARLRGAAKQDLQVLPGIGTSVKAALNEAGITTFAQLAKAKEERLRAVANQAGKRFARFPVTFWSEVAALAQAGEFEKIPVAPPVAEKAKPSGRQRGEAGPRVPRTPRSSSDLGALPSVGKTIVAALNANGVQTFEDLANAPDETLTKVRAASGPKYKSFSFAYWREVARQAQSGNYDYPPVPKKEKPAGSGGRRGRAPRPVPPTMLRALASVGPKLATTLRDNGLNDWQDITDAENWRISKAMSEAGKRFANLNPEDLKRSARDAQQGKFPEPTKRGGSKLPEGADKLRELPGIGAKVQEKLFERKILSYADLADAPVGVLEAVRDEVGRRVAKARVQDWKDLAREAAAGNWSKVDPSKYEDEDEDAAAPKKAKRGTAPKDGDDLTRITGIGPKAQQMYRSRGIKTYQQLVDASDDVIESILDESGPRKKAVDAAKIRKEARKFLKKAKA